jgi:hypothetical protein
VCGTQETLRHWRLEPRNIRLRVESSAPWRPLFPCADQGLCALFAPVRDFEGDILLRPDCRRQLPETAWHRLPVCINHVKGIEGKTLCHLGQLIIEP